MVKGLAAWPQAGLREKALLKLQALPALGFCQVAAGAPACKPGNSIRISSKGGK